MQKQRKQRNTREKINIFHLLISEIRISLFVYSFYYYYYAFSQWNSINYFIRKLAFCFEEVSLRKKKLSLCMGEFIIIVCFVT